MKNRGVIMDNIGSLHHEKDRKKYIDTANFALNICSEKNCIFLFCKSYEPPSSQSSHTIFKLSKLTRPDGLIFFLNLAVHKLMSISATMSESAPMQFRSD